MQCISTSNDIPNGFAMATSMKLLGSNFNAFNAKLL